MHGMPSPFSSFFSSSVLASPRSSPFEGEKAEWEEKLEETTPLPPLRHLPGLAVTFPVPLPERGSEEGRRFRASATMPATAALFKQSEEQASILHQQQQRVAAAPATTGFWGAEETQRRRGGRRHSYVEEEEEAEGEKGSRTTLANEEEKEGGDGENGCR